MIQTIAVILGVQVLIVILQRLQTAALMPILPVQMENIELSVPVIPDTSKQPVSMIRSVILTAHLLPSLEEILTMMERVRMTL